MSEIQVVTDEAKALVRRMLEARERADAAEVEAKRAKKERNELEQEVHAALVESVGHSGQPIDLGPPFGRVRLNAVETIYSDILDENKLQDYLENSAQVEEYTKPQLAKGELNTLARRLKDANEQFPPGLGYYVKRYVRVTTQKG